MSKLICTYNDTIAHRICGGEIKETPLLFCEKCRATIAKRMKGKNCLNCGEMLVMAKGFICKVCKNPQEMVKIK